MNYVWPVAAFLTITAIFSSTRLAVGEESTLLNPTNRPYADELVRLKTPAPGATGTFIIQQDGKPISYQAETTGGKTWVWVCETFAPLETHRYDIVQGKPQAPTPRVTVLHEGDAYLLDNGIVAVKVPAADSGIAQPPGPISAIRVRDKWIGAGAWHTSSHLNHFSSTVTGDGTLFGKIRLRYDFDARAGIDRDQPAFAEFDIALGPDWKHIEVFERHEMNRADAWEMELTRGWSAHDGISHPFSHGAGSGEIAGQVTPDRPLKPGGLPLQQPDLFLNLFPRWNQHYKDGWAFAATDGDDQVGATVVCASQWVWPHDNSIQCIVKESGDYAGFRLSTWHGQRLWWLFGPSAEPMDVAYISRYAWESLDKLNHQFSLQWPGRSGTFAGTNFYSGGMNPTGGLRHAGRDALANADKPGDLSTLFQAQLLLDNDAFGSYWDHWSPENCNFFTDFYKLPIALTARLREHPDFPRLRAAAEARFREDLEHSVTLPGGAGQECPGYEAYALRNWTDEAVVCKKYLGFDPTTWDRFKAAGVFLRRITQPDGNVRRMLPIGDTHPGKDGPEIVDVPADEVRNFKTQELPGLGVIFNNNPGTEKETYCSFKSGPNRGHYHGDQLSIHLCFDAHAIAVDHHCSYHPRAGQEHMHNRVAFSTDDLPYANMDGYERLIAFKTTPDADVAIGQVESTRLRAAARLPPEIWDQRYPQHPFSRPLTYRRTVAMVKNGPKDYLVLRDEFAASEPVSATFCLHVLTDSLKQTAGTIDFGKLKLFCIEPTNFTFDDLPFTHDNGGRESTQGARLTIKADQGKFISVLYPGDAPTVHAIPGGVAVGGDEIIFSNNLDGSSPGEVAVSITRHKRPILTLAVNDIDLNRSQGDIGLFVPDAGYPFGDIPDWLIRQRAKRATIR